MDQVSCRSEVGKLNEMAAPCRAILKWANSIDTEFLQTSDQIPRRRAHLCREAA